MFHTRERKRREEEKDRDEHGDGRNVDLVPSARNDDVLGATEDPEGCEPCCDIEHQRAERGAAWEQRVIATKTVHTGDEEADSNLPACTPHVR